MEREEKGKAEAKEFQEKITAAADKKAHDEFETQFTNTLSGANFSLLFINSGQSYSEQQIVALNNALKVLRYNKAFNQKGFGIITFTGEVKTNSDLEILKTVLSEAKHLVSFIKLEADYRVYKYQIIRFQKRLGLGEYKNSEDSIPDDKLIASLDFFRNTLLSNANSCAFAIIRLSVLEDNTSPLPGPQQLLELEKSLGVLTDKKAGLSTQLSALDKAYQECQTEKTQKEQAEKNAKEREVKAKELQEKQKAEKREKAFDASFAQEKLVFETNDKTLPAFSQSYPDSSILPSCLNTIQVGADLVLPEKFSGKLAKLVGDYKNARDQFNEFIKAGNITSGNVVAFMEAATAYKKCFAELSGPFLLLMLAHFDLVLVGN